MDISITPRQRDFICAQADEILFGGAAGGGKSYGQLVDALLYALRYPRSKQLILRRTYPELEKSLYTVDELTGIIQAAARMRPLGITDMEISSFMKKFKDKKFAAKCDREVIRKGCEMLGMEVKDVAQICIEAMKAHAEELQIGPKV